MSFRHKVLLFLVTGLGAGLSPWAPGTLGSLVAWGLSIACLPFHSWVVYGSLFILCWVLAIPGGTWAERYWNTKDPRQVVIDEWAGIFLAFACLMPTHFYTCLLPLIFFRFFDIIKPFPCHFLSKFPGGYGIMLDDVMASLYTVGVLIPLQKILG